MKPDIDLCGTHCFGYKPPENTAFYVMWLGKTHTAALCIPQEDDLQDSHKHLIAEATFPLHFINEK